MDKLIIGIMVVISAMGVLFMSSSSQSEVEVTGAYSWLTVKYQSCRYLDLDMYGSCVRVERQVPPCNPPQNAFSYGEGHYGWFIRPCTPYRSTKKF